MATQLHLDITGRLEERFEALRERRGLSLGVLPTRAALVRELMAAQLDVIEQSSYEAPGGQKLSSQDAETGSPR